MPRPYLPLNALRAFEASARHLSFTRAAGELYVTQGAVSHQVKSLEERLGAPLFRRLPRGLALTDEGEALLPVVTESFDRMAGVLDRFEVGAVRQALAVGAVGTFAVGWLTSRLARFHEAHPLIDLRLSTHNNRMDLGGDGLDIAIRFGDGAWHGVESRELVKAPLSPICTPGMAARLSTPEDLTRWPLLRSFRADEWPRWFAAVGVTAPPIRGPMFDSSVAMIRVAEQGQGVALAPPAMFERELLSGRLVQPFEAAVDMGAYWLTWAKARPLTPPMAAFADWAVAEASDA